MCGWVGWWGGGVDLGTRQIVYCVFFARHTANGPFAVCSKICTRQKFGHTANWPFPVVSIYFYALLIRLMD